MRRHHSHLNSTDKKSGRNRANRSQHSSYFSPYVSGQHSSRRVCNCERCRNHQQHQHRRDVPVPEAQRWPRTLEALPSRAQFVTYTPVRQINNYCNDPYRPAVRGNPVHERNFRDHGKKYCNRCHGDQRIERERETSAKQSGPSGTSPRFQPEGKRFKHTQVHFALFTRTAQLCSVDLDRCSRCQDLPVHWHPLLTCRATFRTQLVARSALPRALVSQIHRRMSVGNRRCLFRSPRIQR